MVRTTLIFAVLLILLGLIGYAGDPTSTSARPMDSGSNSASAQPDADAEHTKPKRSVTALIPTFAGGLLLFFGAAGLNEKWRMHAMHGAVLIGLLGFLAAGGRGAMGLAKLMAVDAAVNTRSLIFVCVMAVLCGIYVAMCVNSFVQARRRQREAGAQPV